MSTQKGSRLRRRGRRSRALSPSSSWAAPLRRQQSNGDVGSAAHDAAAGSRQQEAGSLGGEQQQRLDEGSAHGGAEHFLAGRASRAGSIQDTDAGRADADLEASVLDTLTDSVLTGAPRTLLPQMAIPNALPRMVLMKHA